MRKTGIALIFALCLCAVEMVRADGIQRELGEKLVRLHIIANSDSEYDQSIKIAVRDELLKTGSLKPEMLQETANGTLSRLGAEYGAEVDLKNRYVPQKTYKNVALPEGVYRCVDVVLGRGGGENWWCIAYPPLCFTEAVTGDMSDAAKEELKKRLSTESLNTILKNEDITFKFKIVEDFQKIMNFLEE